MNRISDVRKIYRNLQKLEAFCGNDPEDAYSLIPKLLNILTVEIGCINSKHEIEEYASKLSDRGFHNDAMVWRDLISCAIDGELVLMKYLLELDDS